MDTGEDDEASGWDLSDVPPDYRKKVVALLEGLRDRGDDVGALEELRSWLGQLGTLAGFSREATLQLNAAIMRCLALKRAPKAVPSRGSLQQAFHRMGGVAQVVNVLLLRLSDPAVVAACARTIAALVQDAPTMAAVVQEDSRNFRLLMRSIETHPNSPEVVQAGCRLIGIFCSQEPQKEGDVCPARAKAHRDSQTLLAQEGAIDLVVSILGASVKELSDLTSKAQACAAAVKPTSIGGDKLSKFGKQENDLESQRESVARVKANVEVRAAWKQLAEEELVHAKMQDEALQALILLVAGNMESMRLLAGTLWCWQEQRDKEGMPLIPEATMPIKAKAKPKAKGKAKAKRRGRKEPEPPPPPPKPAHDLEKQDTMEAFAKSMSLLAEVLQGRACRDRPRLASKVCRLITLIATHNRELLQKVADDCRRDNLRMEKEVKLESHEVPEALFAPLLPALQALTQTLRNHEDITLLSATLDSLVQMREVALLSVPAGVEPGGKQIRWAWSVLLSRAMERQELYDAGKRIEKALAATEVANNRIKKFSIDPSELDGDGIFLTPRLEASAKKSAGAARELTNDAAVVMWKNGDPHRIERNEQRAREREAASSRGSRRSSLASAMGGTGMSGSPRSPANRSPKSRRRSEGGSRNVSPKSTKEGFARQVSGATASSIGSGRRSSRVGRSSIIGELKPAYVDDNGWTEALGYGETTVDDFDRLWRDPMEGALNRSFSTPAMRALAEKEAQPVLPEGMQDTLDKFLDLQLMQAEVGKMKARCIIRPKNKMQQDCSDHRLNMLQDPNATAAVITQTIAKSMRTSGVLLPKFGLRLKVSKGRRRDLPPELGGPPPRLPAMVGTASTGALSQGLGSAAGASPTAGGSQPAPVAQES